MTKKANIKDIIKLGVKKAKASSSAYIILIMTVGLVAILLCSTVYKSFGNVIQKGILDPNAKKQYSLVEYSVSPSLEEVKEKFGNSQDKSKKSDNQKSNHKIVLENSYKIDDTQDNAQLPAFFVPFYDFYNTIPNSKKIGDITYAKDQLKHPLSKTFGFIDDKQFESCVDTKSLGKMDKSTTLNTTSNSIPIALYSSVYDTFDDLVTFNFSRFVTFTRSFGNKESLVILKSILGKTIDSGLEIKSDFPNYGNPKDLQDYVGTSVNTGKTVALQFVGVCYGNIRAEILIPKSYEQKVIDIFAGAGIKLRSKEIAITHIFDTESDMNRYFEQHKNDIKDDFLKLQIGGYGGYIKDDLRDQIKYIISPLLVIIAFLFSWIICLASYKQIW